MIIGVVTTKYRHTRTWKVEPFAISRIYRRSAIPGLYCTPGICSYQQEHAGKRHKFLVNVFHFHVFLFIKLLFFSMFFTDFASVFTTFSRKSGAKVRQIFYTLYIKEDFFCLKSPPRAYIDINQPADAHGSTECA
ncbi:MAG: hypothetical protein J6V92_07910, partial [Bacteroidaceae bacterium]|nr:hypothetical protein [Bacteroidaceae bacterium]